MIELVAATRLSEQAFWNQSALGHSIRRLQNDRRLTARLFFRNTRGLPEIYNERLSAADSAEILAFIHDDVWIDDCFFADRILEGFRTFDVLGVAGNRRRVANQPSWSFIDERFTWDSPTHLSGRVAHGAANCGQISYYGEVPAACELLDGLFLAVQKEAFIANHIQFDPQFTFHFYDLDFCRAARQSQLRLGTCPIGLTHQSAGAFGTTAWKIAYQAYLQKWGT